MEGGKKAAYALRTAIAKECGDHADEVEVIAKVCANLAGLTKAMRRDGSLELETDLKDFSLGFTQGKASFDFVDVGHGKERADSKIKGGSGRLGGQTRGQGPTIPLLSLAFPLFCPRLIPACANLMSRGNKMEPPKY